MKFEKDEVAIMGGVRHGLTLGGPIAIEVGNTEWPKWQVVMSPDPVDPEELANFQRMVWQDEWEQLRLEKPIPLQYRLQAANWLTERGYGKTPAFALVEGEDPMGVTDADREIAALEDELARLREKKLREQAEGSDLAGAGEARADTA